MPDGKTHAAMSAGLAGALAIYGTAAAVPDALVASAGALTGIVMSPDLDLTEQTHSEAVLLHHVPLVGAAWFALWYPYALVMPHRSFWSHFPLVGTAIRVAYLGTVLAGVCWFLGLFAPSLELSCLALLGRVAGSPAFANWFLGLALADALHWLADMLYHSHRKRGRAWTSR